MRVNWHNPNHIYLLYGKTAMNKAKELSAQQLD